MERTHPADQHCPPELAREMRLVHRVAKAVQRDLRLSEDIVEYDELVQYGYVGLLEAKQRFQASSGLSSSANRTEFRTYAVHRIRGAIFDGLRKLTRLPRRAHQLLRLAAPTEHEDLQFQGTGDILDAAMDAGRLFSRSGFLIGQSPYPPEPAPHLPSPEDVVHDRRMAERVRKILAELGDPDREIARRRIFEDHSIAAIAKDLGISRPWAWRVFERAVRNIVLAIQPSD